MKNYSLFAGLLAVAALAGAVACFAVRLGTTTTAHETWEVRGLDAPAELVVDRWGVPHIFAASERDAYFLQGFNAARDRLWQIDLWRKRGLGRLARSFGPGYLAQDRAARLFLYRGDMAAEWNAYAPEARATVAAFVAGINAYVTEVLAGTKPLPVEFRLTGSEPEHWQPEDVLRVRSHTLVANITSEVARARVACAAGVEADELRRRLQPEGHRRVLPDGLDPCDVPADVLDDYVLATQPVTFQPLAPGQLAAAMDRQAREGSNNWVVSPARSATGRAILANDPHRQYGVPSLRYVVGLSAPGLNIIGAGEPAQPGVSLGHNGQIAFGLTIFAMDQEDLYVYETNPDDPDAYRYQGRWEKLRIERELIEVRGEAPREVVLKYTRHGPVLRVDAQRQRAFAMRSAWFEAGGAGYFGASRLTHARSWEDFKTAVHRWGAPPLNLVYADTQGNIGWAAAGLAPVRRNWDGLLPVPGDGRYEWQGFLGAGMLPANYNPSDGFFATANEYNLPADYPAEERKVAFEWSDPSRAMRIREVFAAQPLHSLADSMALQTDTTSPQARRAVALLEGMPATSGDALVDAALQLLRAWDGNESVDSAAAAIYEVWTSRYLGAAVAAAAAPAAARGLIGNGHIEAVLDLLERPGARLGAEPLVARERIMLLSLKAATEELAVRLGGEPRSWAWGRLHRAAWSHALAVRAEPSLAARMSVGPVPAPGSSSTPRAQSYNSADFTVTAGASVRLVLDVGAWDNSRFINTPGQSGDPYSRHFQDLFPLWAEGGYAPLLFSRAAVERAADRVIALRPAR